MGSVVGVYVKAGGPPMWRQPALRMRIERPQGRASRALLIVSEERVAALRADGWPVTLGALGENLVTRGLPSLSSGARLAVGRHAALEITGDCEPCFKVLRLVLPERREAFRDALVAGARGWLARVLDPGEVCVGDTVEPLDKQLSFG